MCAPFVPAGVALVDVQDPAKPRLVTKHVSAPSGAHTVKAHDIGGKTYVFIASYGFSTVNRLASSVEIARIDGDRIVPVTHVFAKRLSGQEGDARTFVHDVWIGEWTNPKPAGSKRSASRRWRPRKAGEMLSALDSFQSMAQRSWRQRAS